MSRHEMVERDDFDLIGMTQAESGLVSEDVWNEMVDRCTKSARTDLQAHLGDTVPLSRGRHHRPDDNLHGVHLPLGTVYLSTTSLGFCRVTEHPDTGTVDRMPLRTGVPLVRPAFEVALERRRKAWGAALGGGPW